MFHWTHSCIRKSSGFGDKDHLRWDEKGPPCGQTPLGYLQPYGWLINFGSSAHAVGWVIEVPQPRTMANTTGEDGGNDNDQRTVDELVP